MNRRNDTPARRDEDRDKMAAFNAFWDRWGKMIVWPAATWIALWLHENYLKPIKAIPFLQAQAHTSIANDSASVNERVDIVRRLEGHDLMFQILVKMQCRDVGSRSDDDLQRLCRNLPDVTAEEVRRIMLARPGRKP
jgi:hypothetical protein